MNMKPTTKCVVGFFVVYKAIKKLPILPRVKCGKKMILVNNIL